MVIKPSEVSYDDLIEEAMIVYDLSSRGSRPHSGIPRAALPKVVLAVPRVRRPRLG